MGRTWQIGCHTFPIVQVLFSHLIPVLWYTSSQGKCIGLPINFPQHWKKQQNPSYEENLKNWDSYFSIVWVHIFHQILILCYSSSYGRCLSFLINFPQHGKVYANPFSAESLRDCFPKVFHSIDAFFFSIRFPSCGIFHHMGNALVLLISHSKENYNKTHYMQITW